MALPAILALAGSAYQIAQAQKQKKMANELEKSNYVPPSLEKSISRLKRRTMSESPTYARSVNKAQESTATAVSRAKKTSKDANSVLSAAARADADEKEVIKDLNVQSELFKLDAEDKLIGLNQQKADIEAGNEAQFRAAKGALRGAAQQNTYNAVTNAASVGISAMGGPKGPSAGVGANVPTGSSDSSVPTTAAATNEAPTLAIPKSMNSKINNKMGGKPSRVTLSTMTPEQRLQIYGTSDINQILSNI